MLLHALPMLAVLRANQHKLFERVKRQPNGCHTWTAYIDDDGYGAFQFRHEGEKHNVRAHRAAYAIEYSRELYPTEIVRHTCDTPSCVNPDHLALGTHADNVADRVRRGRSAVGSDNGRARLSPADVADIRIRYSELVGQEAERLDVDRGTIRAICEQRTWTEDAPD